VCYCYNFCQLHQLLHGMVIITMIRSVGCRPSMARMALETLTHAVKHDTGHPGIKQVLELFTAVMAEAQSSAEERQQHAVSVLCMCYADAHTGVASLQTILKVIAGIAYFRWLLAVCLPPCSDSCQDLAPAGQKDCCRASMQVWCGWGPKPCVFRAFASLGIAGQHLQSLCLAALCALQARLASLFTPPVLPSFGPQLQSAVYSVSHWECRAWLVAYSREEGISIQSCTLLTVV